MYNLFYYNIDKLNDKLYEQEFSKLSCLRQKQINAKKDIDDRRRSLAGDMLAKGCLSRLYKIPEDEIIFARGEHSKPYVLNMNAHFNISHSGKYVVVAVSDVPIGADIEVVRDFSAILAKKTFNDDELAYISGRTPYRKKIEMQKAFYEIWTAKEAYLKYTGQGISGGINSLFFKYENSALVAQNKNIDLVFDYSVPGAVTAIVTQKRR